MIKRSQLVNAHLQRVYTTLARRRWEKKYHHQRSWLDELEQETGALPEIS